MRVERLVIVRALLVAIVFALVASPSHATTFRYTVSGSPEYTVTTTQQGCAPVAEGLRQILFQYRLSLNQYIFGTSCEGEFAGVGSTVNITSRWYIPGVGFDSGVTAYTLDSILEDAPDMERRIASYPVQEVIVLCCSLLLLAVGFSIGKTL